MKKGFTLIELLVVIAVLAVLAAGVFVAIDPVDKINAANDAKVQNDIGQIGQGMEAYAVANAGVYPANATALDSAGSGDLKVVPAPPTGYAAYIYSVGGTSQTVCGQLRSKKYVNPPTSKPAWAWCSSSGKAGPVASCNVTGQPCP